MDLKPLHDLLSDPAVASLVDIVSNVIVAGCSMATFALTVMDRKRPTRKRKKAKKRSKNKKHLS